MWTDVVTGITLAGELFVAVGKLQADKFGKKRLAGTVKGGDCTITVGTMVAQLRLLSVYSSTEE